MTRAEEHRGEGGTAQGRMKTGQQAADCQPSDIELVRQARAGAQKAFRSLFERYHAKIHRMVVSMIGPGDDAHDIVQQAFIRAFSSLDRFKQQSSFYTWLYRIALNATTDYRRSRSRKQERESPGDVQQMLNRLAAPDSEAPDERLYRKELATAIRAAVDTLKPEHRQVLVLREINGLSYAEIAEVTALEPGTVMSRLHYARKKLAEILRSSKILD